MYVLFNKLVHFIIKLYLHILHIYMLIGILHTYIVNTHAVVASALNDRFISSTAHVPWHE